MSQVSERGKGRKNTTQKAGAREILCLLLPVLRAVLYSFRVATYILGYDVYLTTRKILTDENGEGSNARALPCGIRGVGQGVSEVLAMRKIGIPSLVQTRTLQHLNSTTMYLTMLRSV